MYLLANGNGGIQAVVNAIKNLIQFIKQLFAFIANFFRAIIKVFNLLINIVGQCISILDSFPSWLKVFGLLTLAITIIYFIANRKAGSS